MNVTATMVFPAIDFGDPHPAMTPSVTAAVAQVPRCPQPCDTAARSLPGATSVE